MAKSRLDLHEKLVEMLGSRNVYFQPPASVKLNYPCILYSIARVPKLAADNDTYLYDKVYQIIVIDEDPDSEIAEKFYGLARCETDRVYAADNLNHFSFTYYY